MFEGARRIMKLVMIIIALIGIYAAFDASSDIKAGGFTLMDDGASGGGGQPIDYAALAAKFGGVIDDAPQASNDDYSDITKFGGTIDAAPVQQPQQAQETGRPWEKYKTTATEQPKPVQPIDHYEQQAANDEQFVNKQYWPKKAKAILMPLGITALSICGFWIFCWIIGWVVRGFTGISMGQDRKN